jgi:hypothetical protein
VAKVDRACRTPDRATPSRRDHPPDSSSLTADVDLSIALSALVVKAFALLGPKARGSVDLSRSASEN